MLTPSVWSNVDSVASTLPTSLTHSQATTVIALPLDDAGIIACFPFVSISRLHGHAKTLTTTQITDYFHPNHSLLP